MRPLILISGHTEPSSGEFPDESISLSRRYSDAVWVAVGLPCVLPPTSDSGVVREAVARADGVLLSGGEDVEPGLYGAELSPEVQATVSPAIGGRDLFETILIDEVFRQ